MTTDVGDMCPDCLQAETSCRCKPSGWSESEAVPSRMLDESLQKFEKHVNTMIGQPIGATLDLFGDDVRKETPIERTIRQRKLHLLR